MDTTMTSTKSMSIPVYGLCVLAYWVRDPREYPVCPHRWRRGANPHFGYQLNQEAHVWESEYEI